MEVKIIGEYGLGEALYGLGLSFGKTSAINAEDFLNNRSKPENLELVGELTRLAHRLAHKQGGHNKFLESIQVWLLINAPRYWWSQFDTYRAGVTKQSESTMHTLTHRKLTVADFEGGDKGHIRPEDLDPINQAIADKNLLRAKALLPESFLQKRMVSTNYKTLQNIIGQRKTHKLIEWNTFVMATVKGVLFPEWLMVGGLGGLGVIDGFKPIPGSWFKTEEDV